jgi:hypothetical protein
MLARTDVCFELLLQNRVEQLLSDLPEPLLLILQKQRHQLFEIELDLVSIQFHHYDSFFFSS